MHISLWLAAYTRQHLIFILFYLKNITFKHFHLFFFSNVYSPPCFRSGTRSPGKRCWSAFFLSHVCEGGVFPFLKSADVCGFQIAQRLSFCLASSNPSMLTVFRSGCPSSNLQTVCNYENVVKYLTQGYKHIMCIYISGVLRIGQRCPMLYKLIMCIYILGVIHRKKEAAKPYYY